MGSLDTIVEVFSSVKIMRKFLPLIASFIIECSLINSDLFDQAYRKLAEAEEELNHEKIHQSGDQLLKRIGIADGEDEKDDYEPMSESKFMRRFGSLIEDIEDQVAMESKPNLKKIPYSQFNRRMSDEEDDLDVSRIPMEHRGPDSFFSPVSRMGQEARNVMLRAANIVLTPETVATYLAQMWISNIMQTVGWGLVASFFSTANGRSFKNKSSQRRSEDSEREERREEEGESGVLES